MTSPNTVTAAGSYIVVALIIASLLSVVGIRRIRICY